MMTISKIICVTMCILTFSNSSQAQTLTPDLSRFTQTPAAGIHPRVLISPQDLPALRDRLVNTASGRRAISSIRAWLQYMKVQGKPLYTTYQALVAGEENALDLADNSWWANNIPLALCFEAFDALVTEDSTRGQTLAAALCTYVRDYGGNNTPLGYSSVNPDHLMGLSYDFAYNDMTDTQRNSIRNVIAQTIAGRTSHGMDSPAHHATYNFYTHGTQLMIMALAIEGETGYEPTIYPATIELMNNFLTHAIYPSGTPTEGMHYYNFGMNHGAMSLVAMAKRGNNLFGHANYANTRNWYVHSIEPFGYHFSQHGDTPNDQGGLLANYVAMKCVFPNDPTIDFIWRNRVQDDYAGVIYRGDLLMLALYGSDWGTGQTSEKSPIATKWGVDTNNKETSTQATLDSTNLNLPLSFYSPKRGLLIARSAWNHDAAVLHFECRPDVYGPSHAHADRNGFTFSALGRKWAIDRGYHQSENMMHSNVLVDGKGQGYFSTAGDILNYQDTPTTTTITGNATYAYQYRYTFGTRLNHSENAGYTWEPETRERVVTHFSPTQNPNDQPWETNTTYTHRAINGSMQYAYRTATLIRGNQPYALIVDDIRKDASTHLYEWLMQTPNDLEVESIASDRVVLAPINADEQTPRLLILILDRTTPANNPQTDTNIPIRLETYEVARSANSGSSKKFGIGKRLVISSRSIEPSFKIVLLPYSTDDPLPQMIHETDGSVKLQWPDHTDHWTFTQNAQNVTLPTLVQ